jgi:hypothetical protein
MERVFSNRLSIILRPPQIKPVMAMGDGQFVSGQGRDLRIKLMPN